MAFGCRCCVGGTRRTSFPEVLLPLCRRTRNFEEYLSTSDRAAHLTAVVKKNHWRARRPPNKSKPLSFYRASVNTFRCLFSNALTSSNGGGGERRDEALNEDQWLAEALRATAGNVGDCVEAKRSSPPFAPTSTPLVFTPPKKKKSLTKKEILAPCSWCVLTACGESSTAAAVS